MKIKKTIILLVLSLIFLVGCNKADEQNSELVDENGNPIEAQEEVIPEINDYYGAFTRSRKVSDDMRNALSVSLQKCEEIQLSNPSDYWKEKNFASLTLNFLPVADLLQHTLFFNETQTLVQDEEGNIVYDWDSCKQYILSTYTEEEQREVTIERKSPNNYSLKDMGELNGSWGESYRKERRTSAIYDSNHDWSQTLTYIDINSNSVLGQMLEYGRQQRADDKMGFVIQTLKERAYVVYNKDGSLNSFAYSRLNGNILTRYQEREFEILADHNRLAEKTNNFWTMYIYGMGIEEITALPKFDNATGIDYTSYHLEEDSIFTHIDDITADWVMEMENDFDQTIVYDGKNLTVQFYNILSKKIEEYVIHEDGTIDKTIIEMIMPSIDDLMKNIEEKWAEEDEAFYQRETENNVDFNGDGIIGNPVPAEEENTDPVDNTDGADEGETVNAGDTE